MVRATLAAPTAAVATAVTKVITPPALTGWGCLFVRADVQKLFDKLEFEQEQRTINGTLLRLFV